MLGESFHIGRLAVSGPDHEPLVVDWRAPVAEPFYRATGLDPQGLARRRHLAVRGRTVLGLEDEYFVDPSRAPGAPLLPVSPSAEPEGDPSGERLLSEGMVLGGPGALLSALGQARTGHMGDIIGTIQREQDEIIRSPLSGVLVVQGGPGTGKTAVALHRAAYLLYTHRFPLERQGVLVVGPNPLFLRYIEQVLPSLGETGVSLSTVAGLVPEIRVRGVDDAAVAKLKGDVRMVKVLGRAVRTRQRPLRHDLEIPFGAGVLRLRASTTEEIVALARRRPGTHNVRRRFVEAHVLRALSDDYRARLTRGTEQLDDDGPSAEEQADLAAPPAPHPAGGRGAGPHVATPFAPRAAARPPGRTPPAGGGRSGHPQRRCGPAPVPPSEPLARRGAVDRGRCRAHRRGAHAPRPAAAAAHARIGAAPGRAEEGNAQDVGFWPQGLAASPAPTSGPFTGPDDEVRSFGHIVVDEVQDLSPMQLRMLARRSLSGSMTVVGDIAQATGPWAPESWDDVTRHLSPQRSTRLVELTVSYRTPAEVIAVAAKVLAVAAPAITPPRPVRQSGFSPRIVEASRAGLAAAVAQATREEVAAVAPGRVAVLGPAVMLPELGRAPLGHRPLPDRSRVTPRARGWRPVWCSSRPMRRTDSSSMPSWWSSPLSWRPSARRSPARGRRWRRRGGSAPSTWPSRDPRAGWPWCMPNHCPSPSRAPRVDPALPSGTEQENAVTCLLARDGLRSTRNCPVTQAVSVDHPVPTGRIVHDRPPMLAVGVMIWLGSELMFFSGLFAAFFTLRANAVGGVWPPPGTHLDTIRGIIFTLVLISSSFTMQHAVHQVEWRNRVSARRWIVATFILGGAFLGNQVVEWFTITTRWNTNSYGSLFFIMTGLHGLHVFLGLVAMIFLLGRMRGDVGGDPGELSAVQGVSYYWHFVDIVWIGLFSCLFFLK